MKKSFVFYRLEIILRNPHSIFGNSTVCTFDSLDSAVHTANLFRSKLLFNGDIKIYKITSDIVKEFGYEKS